MFNNLIYSYKYIHLDLYLIINEKVKSPQQRTRMLSRRLFRPTGNK